GYEPPQQNWMESKEVKDKINAAKEQLVDQQILLKSILNNNKKQNNSISNWQLWMAGEIIK
ncbi:MAG: hypothetical protein RIR31_463, partial [Bacteroidota bacterium]